MPHSRPLAAWKVATSTASPPRSRRRPRTARSPRARPRRCPPRRAGRGAGSRDPSAGRRATAARSSVWLRPGPRRARRRRRRRAGRASMGDGPSSRPSSRSASAVPRGTSAARRSRSALRTAGRSSNPALPRTRCGMPDSRSASASSSVCACVRTRTAWSAHGRPGAWARRTARAMAMASARSVGWALTVGPAPGGSGGARPPAAGCFAAAEHRGSRVEDLRGGPVAAVELDHLGRRPVPVDVEEEARVGAVPAVDGLLRIAHRGTS